jgi:hypothetical protein
MKADKVKEMVEFVKELPFGFHLDVKGPNKAPFGKANEKGEFVADVEYNLVQVPFTDEFDVKVVVDVGDLHEFVEDYKAKVEDAKKKVK